MDLSRSLAYGLPIIGVLLFSASIGGAVLGSYAVLQEEHNYCGNPLIHVTVPDQIGPLLESSEEGPDYHILDYQELSPAEQRGFRTALHRVDHIGEVEVTLDHLSEIENGVIVLYQGERYYVTLHGDNGCIGMDPLVLPLGILGTIVGAGLVVTPGIWKWLDRSDDSSQTLRHEVTNPKIVIFDGKYADFWVFLVFNIGVLLGLLHWIGLFIGAILLGLVTSSTVRAAILGFYLSCIVALLFTVYDIVISALIGDPSIYPGALFSTIYPSFVTAIPLAVLVAVVVRIVVRTPTRTERKTETER
jgi:hypothetical protein